MKTVDGNVRSDISVLINFFLEKKRSDLVPANLTIHNNAVSGCNSTYFKLNDKYGLKIGFDLSNEIKRAKNFCKNNNIEFEELFPAIKFIYKKQDLTIALVEHVTPLGDVLKNDHYSHSGYFYDELKEQFGRSIYFRLNDVHIYNIGIRPDFSYVILDYGCIF